MIRIGPRSGAWAKRIVCGLLVVLFVALCIAPRLGRLGHPSLIADDIGWISLICRGSVLRHIVDPFNDHLSPLFISWTWALWELGGCRLAQAQKVFTAACYLPFLLVLVSLRAVVRRELESETAALAAIAMFSLSSWVFDEAVYWYAATSFMWALCLTLAAWLCSARVDECGSPANWFGLLLSSAIAPAFSLIGLLAGPIASLRLLISKRAVESEHRRGAWTFVVPMLGTLAYLLLWRFAQTSQSHTSFVNRIKALGEFEVLQSIARAPFEVLLPAIAGLYHHVPLPNFIGHENVHELPWALILTLNAGCLAALLVWAWRSQYRPLILCGCALVYGGYALTLGLSFHGPYKTRISIERYHLYPQLGIVLLLVTVASYFLRRFDRRPIGRLIVMNVMALGLIATHGSIQRRTEYYRAPDQAQTLAAIDRVSEICGQDGITRSQAIQALDPLSRRTWFPHDLEARHNALILLRSKASFPRIPDSQVRKAILSKLSPSEIAQLSGGANVSTHIAEAAETDVVRSATPASMIGAHLVQDRGAGLYVALGSNPTRGWPSFLEYEFPARSEASTSGASVAAARAPQGPTQCLILPGAWDGGAERRPMLELWWADDDGTWSIYRSARWTVIPTHKGWVLPLASLPHFDPAEVRRVRLVFRSAAIVSLQAPRIVR
jgi:hypothetical protein